MYRSDTKKDYDRFCIDEILDKVRRKKKRSKKKKANKY